MDPFKLLILEFKEACEDLIPEPVDYGVITQERINVFLDTHRVIIHLFIPDLVLNYEDFYCDCTKANRVAVLRVKNVLCDVLCCTVTLFLQNL